MQEYYVCKNKCKHVEKWVPIKTVSVREWGQYYCQYSLNTVQMGSFLYMCWLIIMATWLGVNHRTTNINIGKDRKNYKSEMKGINTKNGDNLFEYTTNIFHYRFTKHKYKQTDHTIFSLLPDFKQDCNIFIQMLRQCPTRYIIQRSNDVMMYLL